MRWRSARRDGGISRIVSSGHAEPPGATISPDDTRKPRKTRSPVSPQQAGDRAGDRAGGPLPADAERVAAARHFQSRIEGELTAELRSRLHLTLSGTAATFDWHGRSFTLTSAGFVERTQITPSGGLSAYTLPAWCMAPADTDTQGRQNIAEGELQASLLDYLGIRGSR